MKNLYAYLTTSYLLILLSCGLSFGQSYSGKDFWFGYMENSTQDASTSFQVHIVGDTACTGTLTIPLAAVTTTINFNVNPGVVTTVNVPVARASHLGISDIVANRGVHVVTAKKCVVYIGNYQEYTSDAATAIPTEALSTDYVISGYGESVTNALGNTGEFIVVGTENGTGVTVNLSVGSVVNVAGSALTYTINAGQTIHFKASGLIPIIPPGGAAEVDFAGTRITATKPVAVYEGNNCTYVGACPFCDHLYEQLRPIQSWGYEYYSASSCKGNVVDIGDLIRVFALQDGTNVTFNGVPYTLDANELIDIPTAGFFYVTSNYPIHVTQMLRGSTCSAPPAEIDPLQMEIPGEDQFTDRYTFGTSPYARYGRHYATLVCPTAQTGTLRINGNPVTLTGLLGIGTWTAIPGTTYSYGYVSLTGNNVYVMTSTNKTRFAVSVYGYGVEESYGYIAGGGIINFCDVLTKDTAICPGSTVNLEATVDFNDRTDIFDWYRTQTGGTPVFSGSPYNPGVINAADSFYVQVNNIACNNKRVKVKINMKPKPTADFSLANAVCLSSTTSIGYTGTAPNLPGVTYTWNFGANATPATANTRGPHNVSWSTVSPPPKTVSLSVTENGCVSTPVSKQINVNGAPTSTFTTDKSTYCAGEDVTISYIGTATGITGTFAWNFLTDPDVILVSNPDYKTYVIRYKTSGAKNLTLTASDFGCSGTQFAKAITVATSIALTPSSTKTSGCGANDGTASITASGGTSSYTYSWQVNPVQTGSTANGLKAGAYTVDVKDNSNCAAQAIVTVLDGNAPDNFPHPATDVTCFGQSNGSIQLEVTNGAASGDYTFQLFNSAGVKVGDVTHPASTETFTGLPADNYTYKILQNACTVPGSIVIKQPSKLIAVPATVAPVCPGITGVVLSGSSIGGASGSKQFKWDSNPYGASTNHTVTINNDSTFIFWVKDANGCEDDSALVVKTIVTAKGTLSVTPKVLCQTDSALVTFTYSGPSSAADIFDWKGFDGGVANPGTGAGPHKVNWSIPGKKIINLEISRNGCLSVFKDSLTVSAPPTAFFSSQSPVCENDEAQLSYTGDAPAGPGVTYVWTYDLTGVKVGGTTRDPVVKWTDAGLTGKKTVTLQVKIGANCVSNIQTGIVSIDTIPSPPVVSLAPICEGSIASPFPNASSRGGFLLWYPDLLTDKASPLVPTPSANSAQIGPQTFYVREKVKGCYSDPVLVTATVLAKDITDFNYSKSSFCQGEANPSPLPEAGFTTGGTYSAPSGLVFVSNKTGEVDLSKTTPKSVAYPIVYNTKGLGTSCPDSFTFNMRVIALPKTDFSYSKALYCQNDANPSIVLGSGASVGTLKGVRVGSLPTDPLLKFATGSGNKIDLANNVPGVYQITNTRTSSGCENSTLFSVEIAAVPNNNFQFNGSTCQGDLVNILPIDSVPILGATYTWTFGTNALPQTSNALNGNRVRWTAGGTKTITFLADNKGCKMPLVTKTITIIDKPRNMEILSDASSPIILTNVGNSPINFYPNPATYPDSAYVWNFGEGFPDVTGKNQQYQYMGKKGEYVISLTISASPTCKTMDTIHVVVKEDAVMEAGNSFSPNNDGLNDRFYPTVVGIRVESFKVFNRWGMLMHEEEDQQVGWDGKFKDDVAQDGVYVYVAKGVTTGSDTPVQRVGYVMLKR